MTTSPSPFSAAVKNKVLTVIQLADGQPRTLCVIELARPLTLLIEGNDLVCSGRHGQVTIQPPSGTIAADLLTCIASAVAMYEQRKSRRMRALAVAAALVIAVDIAANMGAIRLVPRPALPVTSVQPIQSMPKASKTPQVIAGSAPPPTAESAQAEQVPADGWLLPTSVRAGLPGKLQKAADRKIFTVDYSTGHNRTLYVFADPECPNCQRLEPALNAAAADFNVVIFPVAVIGQEKSIASITPVLCLLPEQRKAAWARLFDVGHDVMNLGNSTTPPPSSAASTAADVDDCEVANKALGVNEVAYKTYRIPGTPWVIADDGRHVSQDVLQNPLKLQTFMNDPEVAHAAQ